MTDLEALRERLKARRAEREREHRKRTDPSPTHGHGTFSVCPCGVVLGITCVALMDGQYVDVDPCPHCGHRTGQEPSRYHQDTCTYYDEEERQRELLLEQHEREEQGRHRTAFEAGPPCAECFAWEQHPILGGPWHWAHRYIDTPDHLCRHDCHAEPEWHGPVAFG